MSKLDFYFFEQLLEDELKEDHLEIVHLDEHLNDHAEGLELFEQFLNHSNDRSKRNQSL